VQQKRETFRQSKEEGTTFGTFRGMKKGEGFNAEKKQISIGKKRTNARGSVDLDAEET